MVHSGLEPAIFGLQVSSADPEGGTGGPEPPPPWDLSEVGSCVEAWWVGEGVQRLFSLYYFQFFSGSLRSPVLYKRITYIHTFKFNIQSSFLYITLILMKRIQLTISCFHERASSYFSCLKLHDLTQFKTKIFRGRTSDPPPPTRLQYKTTMTSLCLCREGLAIVQKTMPYRKKACM